MAVRPPSNGGDEPEAIEFGIAAVDARVDEADLAFPATDDDVLDALGDGSIPYDASGREMSLATALSETDRSEYDSERELLNALHPVFERRRNATSIGLLDRLRGMLPF